MFSIQTPRPYQVFQRNQRGRAAIPVALAGRPRQAQVRLLSRQGEVTPWQPLAAAGTGRLSAPVGGPYTLEVQAAGTGPTHTRRVRGLLVGDLWITAGQSNMDGVGQLSDREPPSPLVHAFYFDDRWAVAEEPLCWYQEAVDPVHWGVEETSLAEAARSDRLFRTWGVGPAVAFGKALAQATGIPVGLVVCSHGGTSMEQWSPAQRGQGGKSFYGSLLRRVAAVGGRVQGIIWYQGESDANAEAAPRYRQRMRELVAALRQDLAPARLPFLYVQIASIFGGDPAQSGPWDQIRHQQLELEQSGELAPAAQVPALDSTLCDAVHVDARSQRRLGRRLAVAALRLAFGRQETTCGPRRAQIRRLDGRTLRVSFREANGHLATRGRVWGFALTAQGQPVAIADCRVERADRSAVLIRLPEPVPGELELCYGQGFVSLGNLHDRAGWPAPAFGPVTVPAAPGGY